jgi:hypothetical protein
MKKETEKKEARRRRESRREHNPVKAGSEETATLARGLAPLEELEEKRGSKQHPNGAIVLDTSELKLPRDLMEKDEPPRGLGLEPVVIFILVLALAFIAFIAYMISIEPPR